VRQQEVTPTRLIDTAVTGEKDDYCRRSIVRGAGAQPGKPVEDALTRGKLIVQQPNVFLIIRVGAALRIGQHRTKCIGILHSHRQ
jgi:hypothetical protein